MTAYAVSPTGTVTRYGSANWMQWLDDGSCKLWRGKPDANSSSMVARIPADHIVSFDKPGVETKGVSDPITAEIALDIVSRSIRSFKPGGRWSSIYDKLRTLKDELRAFDARSGEWKS